MKKVRTSGRGNVSWAAISATLTATIYALSFGSLFIPLNGFGYSVVDVALPIIFLSIAATILFASLAGRKAGLSRTIGIVCGVFLIVLPLAAEFVAKK